MTPETCTQILNWRYATKEFDPNRKISPEAWEALRQTLLMAPSSFGMELWRFIDVQTPSIRHELKAASWDQDQVTDASHFIVVCVRRDVTEEDCDRHIERICEIRGMTKEMLQAYKAKFTEYYEAKDSCEARSWIDRQSYIALGFAMFAAASMQIDTCAIEGMLPERYDEILGLTGSPYKAICGLAFGYRNPADRYASFPKVRFGEDDIIRTV